MAFSKELALERLSKAHLAGRLGHAYLLAGSVGCGKAWLANQLAALLLECAPDKVASHPDAHKVQPESKSRRIVIDQMRALEQSVQRKPLLARHKVIIIHEADRMQPQAANAFLKTLEEPPPNSLILLLSAVPEAMLETILSRCVETPLQSNEIRKTNEEETIVLKAIDDCLLRPTKPGAAEAFRFTRTIQGLLADLREGIGKEYDASLKEDAARYKQTSDSASWLEDRADQIKALTEAAVLRERERVLQVVFDILSSGLRAQHGFPPQNSVIQALAEKFSTKNLLQRLDALETLRRRLAMGVQEALALESGFLKMICLS
ncbi:hypothetical protein BH09VER1_BH09VER1_45260 [soil metagenome]